jgi:hypothetical protein
MRSHDESVLLFVDNVDTEVDEEAYCQSWASHQPEPLPLLVRQGVSAAGRLGSLGARQMSAMTERNSMQIDG